MKNAQYFRHDASAYLNKKLTLLMAAEGARGYGVYWFILELLRQQTNFRLPLTYLRILPGICHTHRMVVERVVRNYDLFVVDEKGFYSPGMNKRMSHFTAKIFKNPENTPQVCDDNRLETSEDALLSARIAEQRRAEQKNNSSNSTAVAEDSSVAVAADSVAVVADSPVLVVADSVAVAADSPVLVVADPVAVVANSVAVAADSPVLVVADSDAGQLPLKPIRRWESLVDDMAADTFWMELVGMRSGLGQLYIDHRGEVVELFRQHICLYDKGGGLLRLQDVKQYFANYLAAGSRTCQGVRDRLLDGIRQQQARAGVSPYETIVDGRRTYLGRVIPDSAPPRPDEFSVWDEEKRKWTR